MASYGEQGVVGFVVEGGKRERASKREKERERERTGHEPLRAEQILVVGEGGACSLPEVGLGVRCCASSRALPT